MGYIFFWLTNYLEIVILLTKIEAMSTFVFLLITAILLGIVIGGKLADLFVKNYNLRVDVINKICM